MKERPIIFSTPMVQAILQGRKTMTRRIIKPQPVKLGDVYKDASKCYKRKPDSALLEWQESETKCPYGNIGDRLWVRETWAKVSVPDGTTARKILTVFKASICSPEYDKPAAGWKPSIHMPKSISRICLEITNIKIEKVQEISQDDAISEGVLTFSEPWINKHFPDYFESKTDWIKGGRNGRPPLGPCPCDKFEALWESINGKESWISNPWVWVIEFKVL